MTHAEELAYASAGCFVEGLALEASCTAQVLRVPVPGWLFAHMLRACQGGTCILHPVAEILQAAASITQVLPGSVHLV